MPKQNKKKSSLLDEIINNSQVSGTKLDINNASELSETRAQREFAEWKKGDEERRTTIDTKRKESKTVVKMQKKSFDLSEETIRNLARLKHWEQLSSEGAAIEFILKPYFKKHPQEPLKNEKEL